MGMKKTKAMRGKWREEGKTNDTSTGKRGREIEREIERLSEAEQEWKRVGVHSRATSTAVHCSAQPPLRSLLTIRLHALKRPLQQQSCTAQRAACWWTATSQRAFDPPLCILDMWWFFFFFFQGVMQTRCSWQNRRPAPASLLSCRERGSSQFTLPLDYVSV